jgi:hypothetical protein
MGQGQSPTKKEYLHGWEMFKIGRYEMAMEILKPLTLPVNKSPFTPYAGYYYSLAAYNQGYHYLAEEMLKYILREYHDWEQNDYLRFWLVNIYMTEREYSNGLSFAARIHNPGIKEQTDELVRKELYEIDSMERLISLYKEYREYKAVGEVLADRIVMQPILDQDRVLLNTLVRKFDLDGDKYNIIDEITSVKKSEYNIAILFPFMLADIVPNQVARGNEFILDLYEGMKIAQSDLKSKGVNLNLYAFDTKMDSTVTRNLVRSGQLNGMDLIIGPLYPDPVKIISEFSFDQRINMFNPLSTNSNLISNNPFCFLMKPSAERQAREAGQYITSRLDNPYGMIFYEDSDRDSVMAYSFLEQIKEDSFHIIQLKKITSPDSVNVYNYLTHKVKFSDLAYSQEDSLRLVREYMLEDFMEDYIRQGRGNNNENEPEILMVSPDSIGYIFIASNSELIGANTISGVETRGDSILIIGNESWLNFKSLSLEQLEMLNIILIAPGYVKRDNYRLENLNMKIIEAVNKLPNKYHYTGYELLYFVGEMLNSYGVYFQTGMSKIGKYPGIVFEGFDYSEGNDNAVVPIIRFDNSEFKILN